MEFLEPIDGVLIRLLNNQGGKKNKCQPGPGGVGLGWHLLVVRSRLAFNLGSLEHQWMQFYIFDKRFE